MAGHPTRTWIELSRAAVRGNFAALSRRANQAQVMAVVKSNAYGHGVNQIVHLLPKRGLWGLGVAYGQEALQLSQQGFTGHIAALSAWEQADLPELAAKSVDIVVHDFTTLKAVAKLAQQGRGVRFHLKLDSGTTRIGFLAADIPALKRALQKLPRQAQCVGVFTHYANAEERSSVRTMEQITCWRTMRQQLGETVPLVHSACTAAVIRYPQSHDTVVRPGLGLYGIWPSAEIRSWAAKHNPTFRLQPVLRWSTHVLAVKHVPAGTAVGYSSTYRLKRAGTIAVLPVGYGDGLRRSLGNVGSVAIRGQSYPMVGRICMNMTMVDISTARQSIRPGDPVELIGPTISAEDHARWAGTIAYDILTGLSPTIPRLIRP